MRTDSNARFRRALCALLAANIAYAPALQAAVDTPLADGPITATRRVPPNMLLALSVEWPTGLVAAYNDNVETAAGYECPGRTTDTAISNIGVCYFPARTYIGYFDAQKCYTYNTARGYFEPSGAASGTDKKCSGAWSGNFLNWSTMQAIDTFRFALTGGDRYIDTPAQTVIEKARHTGTGGHGQFPIKRVQKASATVGSNTIPGVDPRDVSPLDQDKLYVRVTAGTTELRNALGNYDGPRMEISSTPLFAPLLTQSLHVRVEVCNAGAGLEANCRRYGSAHKPTGLIQQNADRMRFGVMGYLLDNSSSRQGGVLRARMKDLGPTTIDPLGTGRANGASEWDANGVFTADPDSADSTASAVSQSGVINYLNKFGKASGYKSYDPIGELYYEGLRYFSNQGPSTEAIAGVTDPMKDGFPVITDWRDPVQYSCQKNVVAMIADVNAWCDTRLPGTSVGDTAVCGGRATMAPSNAGTGVNVSALVDRIAGLEGSASLAGLTQLSNVYAPASTGRRNSWYLAGLAYHANTTDLRPDLTRGTSDRVTMQTFMVDVAETGSWSVGGKNQMWMAAKYGGFNDLNRNGVPPSTESWDANGDGTPDNYFLASRPDKMIRALSTVFDNAIPRTESASGATIVSPRVAAGDGIYQIQYDSTNWSGDVLGSTMTVDAAGVPTVTTVWRAQPKLDALVARDAGRGWDTARVVTTWDGRRGVPFRSSDLTSTQRATLGASSSEQSDMIAFLRGDRSKEGNPFRRRTAVLGDVVGSEAVVVAGPNAPYAESDNPGYAAFAAAQRSRPRMLYVGANDGMLHAFDADVSSATAGGGERWAYVPSALFAGPSSPSRPNVDGLAALAQTTYANNHKFFVDATPTVADVDFARTGRDPSGVAAGTSDWRTILVGGLGKGGRSYYAIEVTDPTGMTTEAAVAGKVLWEFTDEDMGLGYGRPLVTKLRKHGWVVILASGYNNNQGNDSNKGKGFLYILNASTGQLLEKIGTGEGSAGNPAGLARVTPYTVSYADYTTEQVYGGDLLGNVWRFDLSAATGAYPAPELIATLTDARGRAQPVTSAPQIEVAGNGRDRWVFVGTGKLLDHADLLDTQQQTIYAIRDGSKTTPQSLASPPAGVRYPLTRDNLTSVGDLTAGTATPVAPAMGWKYDLTGTQAASGATERVMTDLVANEGTISWVGNVPSADPCSPGVASRTYAVRYDTARSALVQTSGTTSSRVAFIDNGTGLVKLQFVKVGARVRLLASERTTRVVGVPGNFGGLGFAAARVNWRLLED